MFEQTQAARPMAAMKGKGPLKGRITVTGERNAASFVLAGALIVAGSDIMLEKVPLTPAMTEFLRTVTEMGGDVDLSNPRLLDGVESADIRVRHSELHGVIVPPARIPVMIDELPALAVAAAFARGRTEMRDIGEMRLKRTDRIEALSRGLAANGVECHQGRDYLLVEGQRIVPGGGSIETGADHRIAMSFLVLGMAAEEAVIIDDMAPVMAAFPDFIGDCTRLGAEFQTLEMVS